LQWVAGYCNQMAKHDKQHDEQFAHPVAKSICVCVSVP